MTVEQALARARELRPGCKISDETCRRWLCEEDALLRQQLFEKSGADEYAAAGADLAWSGEALPDDTVLLVFHDSAHAADFCEQVRQMLR